MYKLAIVFIFFLLAACLKEQAGTVAPNMVSIENAWIREAPPNALTMAGYLTIHNKTTQDRILTFAKSQAFKTVEFHRTIIEDGIAKMRHQDELLIPAGTSLVFKPGDFHLMMMEPKTALHMGDEVTITLCFKNAGVIEEIDITLSVKKLE